MQDFEEQQAQKVLLTQKAARTVLRNVLKK